ncbi:MAG TPA: MotA/TolQ/ExbB proton channel family protein [Kiritimatiellia bacterium]|nr:MotA/TolQ/ExbB proton channel family protein [Kiritimatiellia bacterium]HMO98800.1 MotA/TolQ/ExbB proton channel family protein [Kiritimatiellia bacterium]HMP96867.1 MotA/TolQ/ExbB proton channel family protein [Kiritimatiellia bacterium]
MPHSFLFLPPASVWYSFATSDFSGKVIIFLLLGMSVYAWTIMVSKYGDLRRARSMSERFVNAYRRDGQPLGLFLQRQRFPESPVYRVYEKACMAVGVEIESRDGRSDASLLGFSGSSPRLSLLQLGAIRNAAEREVADQVLELENRMGTLATAVSASPLMGLLGTVWGVMNSFTGMAMQGSANLSAVAPGIAAALLTTVIALIVALPSAIGYNILTSQIRNLTVQMDNFADALVADMQRSFIRE